MGLRGLRVVRGLGAMVVDALLAIWTTSAGRCCGVGCVIERTDGSGKRLQQEVAYPKLNLWPETLNAMTERKKNRFGAI